MAGSVPQVAKDVSVFIAAKYSQGSVSEIGHSNKIKANSYWSNLFWSFTYLFNYIKAPIYYSC